MKPLQRLEQTMQRMNYSPKTIRAYTSRFRQFCEEMDKHTDRISKREIEEYLNQKKLGVSAQNIFINAIKCYYEKVLGQNKKLYSLKRPRRNKRLPKVIDSAELHRKLKAIKPIKPRTMLILCYVTGMRVSELVQLKIEDIDSNRMLICIRNGKGRKDRFVPISDKTLKLLRAYYIKTRPKDYLFPGKNDGYISPATAQKYYKRYIDNSTGIHTLRHSCFTHLIEKGYDIAKVQKVAGHNHITTTEQYIHLSQKTIKGLALSI